jgi:hypothetical protein
MESNRHAGYNTWGVGAVEAAEAGKSLRNLKLLRMKCLLFHYSNLAFKELKLLEL